MKAVGKWRCEVRVVAEERRRAGHVMKVGKKWLSVVGGECFLQWQGKKVLVESCTVLPHNVAFVEDLVAEKKEIVEGYFKRRGVE